MRACFIALVQECKIVRAMPAVEVLLNFFWCRNEDGSDGAEDDVLRNATARAREAIRAA